MKLSSMTANNKINGCRGMTLIEVVIALAILAILLTVSIGSLGSINRSKRTLDDYQEVYLVAQSLLRRMTRELQLASCEMDDNSSKCEQGKGIILPPDEKGAFSVTPVLRSRQTRGKDNSVSDITFLAMDAGQYLQERDSNLGMVQISYRLNKIKSDDNLYQLIREEVPLVQPAEEAYRQALVFPIANNVVSMNFEFYDMLNQGEWNTEWGTESSRLSKLPTLIRCTLVLRSASGIDVPFRTMVAIRTSTI